MLSNRSITKIFCGSALLAAMLLSTGSDAFAQKGHGNGGGKGGGNGHGNNGGGWGRGNGGGNGNGHGNDKGQGRVQQQQWGGWQQQRQQQQQNDWNQRRQQQQNDWNARRQQQVNEWNQRRQQQQVNDWNARRQQQVNAWNQRRQQQQQNDWNARRQQQMNAWNQRRQQQQVNDWNARRQQQVNAWNQRRQQQQVNDWNARRQQMWSARGRRGDNERWQRNRWNNRDRGRNYYSVTRGFPTIIVNGGQWNAYNDYRDRRDMKWAWKAQKRAQKRFERDQRRAARYNSWGGDSYYYDNNYYGDNYGDYTYSRSSGWKEQILRAVIGNVIGGFGGDRYLDASDRYEYPSYSRYERRPAYYNSPVYVGYNDYGYGQYEPEYSDYGDDPSGYGGLLQQLPIGDLLGQFGGDDFVSSLLGNFLAQGYDEGFLAGEWAKENGYGDKYYNDPYEFEGVCDPYSTSLGRNRQFLSEGYNLGFQDALQGRNDYDPLSEGNLDLVSLLLGGALGNS